MISISFLALPQVRSSSSSFHSAAMQRRGPQRNALLDAAPSGWEMGLPGSRIVAVASGGAGEGDSGARPPPPPQSGEAAAVGGGTGGGEDGAVNGGRDPEYFLLSVKSGHRSDAARRLYEIEMARWRERVINASRTIVSGLAARADQ